MTNLGPLSFNNSGNPTSNLHVYSNTNTAGANTPQIRFPNTSPTATAGSATLGGGGLDQGVDPNFRDPQSNQWNVTVERELTAATSLRATCIGMHTYRLSITEDLNQLPANTTPYNVGPNPGPFVDPRAPYQNWTTLLSTFNAGESNYHAFELQATHRMQSGLYFDANYTFAKNVADNQGDAPGNFAGEVNYGLPIADRFHIKQDLGNVQGTRRHRALLTGVYQLPFGKGRHYLNDNRITDTLFGGWDLTTITLLETGPWLTPSISPSADQSNTNLVNRSAVLRPDTVSPNFYTGQSRPKYFNQAAFAPTPVDAGRFGNAGVGILQGPGISTVSLGVAKRFAITERVNMRFETTFTNILNHTNFAPPVTAIDNSLFGQLTGPQTAERRQPHRPGCAPHRLLMHHLNRRGETLQGLVPFLLSVIPEGNLLLPWTAHDLIHPMRPILLLLLTVPALAQTKSPALLSQLQAIAAQHHGEVSLYAEDLTTHETVALAPDAPVQTASVIKLAILYEALEQIRAGHAHFDDRLTLAAADRVPGSGILRFLDAPLALTLKDVLTLMIVMSDNAATNLAIDHLGLAHIDARIARLGLKDTYLYKKVFTPVDSGTILPADFKQFGFGKTTPREIATLMTRFVRCELADPRLPTDKPQPADPALCTAALDMLHHQFTRTAIPRYLDSLPGATETSIANKTGALDAVRNDVAAISTPHGIILISCFTSANRDRSWSPDHEAELTIARLARAILGAWSPDGLAPWPKIIDKAPAP